MNLIKSLEKQLQGFRPLTGTLLSKLKKGNKEMEENSFRPLTGTLLSKLCNNIEADCGKIVSVPSRGLSYLNAKRKGEQKHDGMFPSPHGDSLI